MKVTLENLRLLSLFIVAELLSDARVTFILVYSTLRFQWLNYCMRKALLTYIQAVITPRLFIQPFHVTKASEIAHKCFRSSMMRFVIMLNWCYFTNLRMGRTASRYP